ncbi:hypothetical protein SAMN04489867_2576 [Pedococcus dokdonensis]|uniref:Uncharacterized protein n=1 Tax=Pedococcus dokdonensis TaxID=443156 RepID=A0A1H0SZI5_9MICO|nr:hypothetical protein [Pedococcus dokdonensis]SDP47272.1 hypothetical protein SAMN04489867_2576 [Pedococcus dokdonensis]
MAGQVVGLLVLPLVVGLLVSGVLRVVDTVRSRGAARAAQARSLVASAATGLAGLAATAVWLSFEGDLTEGVVPAALPAVACTVAVLTAAVAELTWPRPAGAVRTADLTSRRTPRPARLSRLVVVGLSATALALLVGTLTAAPDGRSFDRTAPGFAAMGFPYPGAPYAVTVGIASVVLALATWFGWSRVDARPSLGPGHAELDAAIRGASMVRVLRPAAVGSLTTAAALWLSMGATIGTVTQNLRMNVASAPQPPFDWVQNLGFAAVGAGVALLLLTLAALLSGSPRLPRQDPAPVRDPAEVGA